MTLFYRFMHEMFYHKLCPRPDGWFNMTFRGWPYNFTGKIADFFHRKTCDRCREFYAEKKR